MSNEDSSGYGLNDMPPIRGNPQVARASQQRRLSVANPNPVQIPDPADDDRSRHTSDTEQESVEIGTDPDHNRDDEDDDEDDASSVSDLNKNESEQIDEALDEEIESGAMDTSRLQNANKNGKIATFQAHVNQMSNQMNGMNGMNNGYNEYLPGNMGYSMHRRNDTNHSRSRTTAVLKLGNPESLVDRPLHRRTKSQLSEGRRGKQRSDFTFMCTRIEAREVYKKGLQQSSYEILLRSYKKIIGDCTQRYGGSTEADNTESNDHLIDSNDSNNNATNSNNNNYDFMIAFTSVHAAIECAVAIQVNLNNLQWPDWFKSFEQQSQTLQYSGSGPNHVFNGIRVGIGLHTAREGVQNPYDLAEETLTRRIEQRGVDLDIESSGTAVDLVHRLCGIAYGGEILASKAVQEAYNRDRSKNQRTADKLFIQQLGSHHFEKLRRVDLVQFTPQELQARSFPMRQFHATEEEAKKSNQMLEIMSGVQNMASDEYDPFPKGSDEDESSSDDNNNAKRRRDHARNEKYARNPRDIPRNNNNESNLTESNLAKNDASYNRNRRNNRQEEHSEHSSEQDKREYRHFSDPSQKHLDLDNLDLTIDSDLEDHMNHKSSNTPQTESSILSIPKPPEPSRSKQKEIQRRRNSLSGSTAPFRSPSADNSTPLVRIDPAPNDTKHRQYSASSRTSRIHAAPLRSSSRPTRSTRVPHTSRSSRPSGHSGPNTRTSRRTRRDDEHSSDSDLNPSQNALIDPHGIVAPPPPIRNKRDELRRARSVRTGDTSVGTPRGSETSSKRTGSSIRRMRLQVANPKQMLLYYEARPPDLPGEYGVDQEFVCLNCNQERKWTDGVWRCPMWPSFDVCSECANTVLSMTHQAFKKPARHMNLRSDAAMLQNQQPAVDVEDINNNQRHDKLIHSLRKELSSIIEMLTDQKLKRLKNVQDWCLTDGENGKGFGDMAAAIATDAGFRDYKKFYLGAKTDYKNTEMELAEWRNFQNKQDLQDIKLKRRQSNVLTGAVGLESPNASDLESDEDLANNFEEYDPHADLNIIHKRLTELNNLFWTEDEVFRKKVNGVKLVKRKTLAAFEKQFAQLQGLYGADDVGNDTIKEAPDQESDESSEAGMGGVAGFANSGVVINGEDKTKDSEEDDPDGNGKIMGLQTERERQKKMAEMQKQLNHIQETYSQKIDTYISQIHRKDTELHQANHDIDLLKERILEMRETRQYGVPEDVEELQNENETLKARINELIVQTMYQDPETGNESDSDKLREELNRMESEKKELSERLAAAEADVDRLAQSKISLIKGTSNTIESLRDEICSLNDKLQIQTVRVEELTKLNSKVEEKIDEAEEGPEGARVHTSILSRASAAWTMGRSKFSTPLWKQTVADTNESKIRLAKETAKEMERLRDIIRVLSNLPGQRLNTLGKKVANVATTNARGGMTTNGVYGTASVRNDSYPRAAFESKTDEVDREDTAISRLTGASIEDETEIPAYTRQGTSIVWNNKDNMNRGIPLNMYDDFDE